MCCRARPPKHFWVRANMMIKKKSVKTICCYDQKQQPPFFSHLLFFVAIACSIKKMLPKCCPTIKKFFCLENFPNTVPGDEKLKVTLEVPKLCQHNSRKSYTKCFCTTKIDCSTKISSKITCKTFFS